MGEGHICVDDAKNRKMKKMKKRQKKCHEGHRAQIRPPSPTKQMVWRRYQTGLSEVMSIFDQNLMKKYAFYLQILMRKPYEIKNSGFYEQWFFKPILTETYILLHDLHHFFESDSFKRGSRRATAVHKVHSYLGEKQSWQNALIARYHAKNLFLTTSPVRERDSCWPLKPMDFPKSHVLKLFVKIMMIRG